LCIYFSKNGQEENQDCKNTGVGKIFHK
jgi:hypothetical protein